MRRLFLCLGSENKGDDLALEICDSLKGLVRNADFLKCTDPFEIPDHMNSGREVIIVDVVKSLKKTKVFKGADEFAKTKSVTAHDLDACTVLKLLEAADKTRFRIIGVPFGADKKIVAIEAERIIQSLHF